jgi:cytochrome c553
MRSEVWRRRRGAARWLAGGLLAAAAAGPAAAQPVPQRLAVCAACHGPDGNATVPGTPSLAGQPGLFLENQMVMIREGLREVPLMKGLLDGLKDEELVALARHYAAQAPRPAATSAQPGRMKRGAELSARGLCGTCHLPDYRGRDQVPRLAQQREDYLLASLRLFLGGQATGRDTLMTAALQGFTDAELQDLAHYFAHQAAAAASAAPAASR